MDRIAIALRFLLYLDLMALFGVAAFAIYALRGDERVAGAALPLAGLTATTALAGIVLSVAGLVALAANLSGTALPDKETLATLIGDTSLGTAWLIRIAALVIAGLAAAALSRGTTTRQGLVIVASAGAVATATLAWAGHGAADDGTIGWLHLGADIIHLIASGIWVGALLAFALLIFRSRRHVDHPHLLLARRTLGAFAPVGTTVVAMLIATGAINVVSIVGLAGIARLPTTLYGELLLVKLLLLAAMLALAATNRFRLIPNLAAAIELDDRDSALLSLRRSLALELGFAVIILGLVGWFGTLDPTRSS